MTTVFGTQKVFCSWNSCHTRQPLLETPMLPQWWWLYVRISYRNAVESCLLGVLLLHDNAPAHKSCTLQAAIRKCDFVELNHPPFSPDLAPSSYFPFRNVKKFLRGQLFLDDNGVKEAVTEYFDTQDV